MKLPEINVKKVVTVVTAVGCGVMAVVNSLSDQKREQEFRDMKKIVSELQSKNGES